MFSITGLSPSTADHSRPLHLTHDFLTRLQPGRTRKTSPTTPHAQPLPGITCAWFSLLRFRSPLLTESLLFSLPMGTEMFHFPTFPPHRLYIQRVVTRHHSCWVSPFGHPRITARLTTPRGLSRPTTSFIGSWCQGIHRTPLNTYNNTYKQTPPQQQSEDHRPARLECRNSNKHASIQKHNCDKNKDARIHYALLKQHTPATPPPLRDPSQTTSPRQQNHQPKGNMCSLRTPIACRQQHPSHPEHSPHPPTPSRHQQA